jgi:uracil-DNA glycosylase family 4
MTDLPAFEYNVTVGPHGMTSKERELLRLARGAQHCHACPLHRDRIHAVPGEGPATARAILVGEAPGRREDETGRPFIGRSGKFLDGLIEEAGLDRSALFITSSVKCRPPRNRDPLTDELATCRHRWLERQIETIGPRVIVLLGRTPARQLLDETRPLKHIRRRLLDAAGRRVLLTYHPAAAMRFAWVADVLRRDLRRLAALLRA